jgi:hypothetical protein
MQQAASTTCSFETSHRGGATLFTSGQLGFPRRKVEAPCRYENYLAKKYQRSYVVVKDLKVDFSACQKTNYIVQGGSK